MTYCKPEIANLGDASEVIQGSKSPIGDGQHVPGPPAFEMED
jgi:hypothetical protein